MGGDLGVGHGPGEEQQGNTMTCSEDSGPFLRLECSVVGGKEWETEKAGHFTQISSQREHVPLPQTDT